MAVDAKTTAVSREDPRVKRTRRLLQDAFVALLGEKGFHAISVQDIAERATVNRATFYAHYQDKYDLFDQMAGETFRQALSNRVSADSPLTQANLETLIVTAFEALAQIHDHCRPVGREIFPLIEAKAQEELEAFLSAWLGQQPSIQPGQGEIVGSAATVASWAIFGAGIEWSRGTRTRSAEQAAHHVLNLLTDGLMTTLELRLTAPHY